MAWLEGYSYRVPITCDMSGLSGSGVNDVQVTLPTVWSHFWDEIDASGHEIVVTTGDGTTDVSKFDWSSFTKATKTGVLEIEDVAYAHAPSVVKLFLYYGNSGAPDKSSAFTPSSAVAGHIELLAAAAPITLGRERPGAQTPVNEISITTSEHRALSIDLQALLRPLCQPEAGSRLGEEISEVTAKLTDTNDGTVANGIDVADTRVHACQRMIGQTLTVYIDGSQCSDGSNYAANLAIYTTNNSRAINARIAVRCENVRPRT
jgi:hypothetical protein